MRPCFLLLVLVLVGCAPSIATPTVPAATTLPLSPTAAMDVTTAAVPSAGATTTALASGPVAAALAPLEVVLPASFRPLDRAAFAPPTPRRVQSTARVAAAVPAADLANVEAGMLLAPEQRARLGRDGFVVSPNNTREFYEVYERVRYEYVPAFVSSDAILHSYHLAFDGVLRRVEANHLAPMLARLDWELAATSLKQAEQLAGTPFGDAARRNAAYFAVAVKLLYPQWPLPAALADLAEPDLAQIATHSGVAPSAIFPDLPQGEDWTQYTPRGHYTTSDALGRYFQAMMWHGRMALPIDSAGELLMVQALRTTLVAQEGAAPVPAAQVWQAIYDATAFFVGQSDDLTPLEAFPAFTQVYGETNDVRALGDEAKLARFAAALKPLRDAKIVSAGGLEGKPSQGLRFMGQRLVPDAEVFQRLVDPQVPRRALPRSLDFFAALGSARALELVRAADPATAQAEYAAGMEQQRAAFASYDAAHWGQNLYWGWIDSLRPLLDVPGEGYPAFMRGQPWLDKQLNTALGSWSELKHDTVLYAKQVYVEGGGGTLPPPTPALPKGYVEPVPALFARVASLSEMTRDGLDARGMLDDTNRVPLDELIKLASKLQAIAEQQLRDEPRSDEDYAFIRTIGGRLERIALAAASDGGSAGLAEGERPAAAIVSDIATNATLGSVLYVATGAIADIYVVVPMEGKLVVARGGVFSHYEFEQPLAARLTDEAWRERLARGEAPSQPAWTSSFVEPKRVEQPLAETILGFNNDLAAAFWYAEPSGQIWSMVDEPRAYDIARYLAGAELDDTRNFLSNLRERNQYIGARRERLDFLSFDFPRPDQAIVATRERWSDRLYSGQVMDISDETPPIGQRSYESTVTYTLERGSEGWRITRIVLDPEPPGWQTP